MTTPPPVGRLGYMLVEHGNWGRIDIEGSLFDNPDEAYDIAEEMNARPKADRGSQWFTVAEVLELEDRPKEEH